MRILQPSWPQEKLLRRGTYHYFSGGQPTGDVEHWQVTRLPDGSHIVRADLDGRDASGASLLATMRRDPDGSPMWLRLRFEHGEINTGGQYNFRADAVDVVRLTGDFKRRMETVEIATDYVVNFHALISYEYVWRGYPEDAESEIRLIPVFSPELWVAADDVLTGRALRVSVRPDGRSRCEVPAGTFEDCRCFAVELGDGIESKVWFDEHGTPLRWHYPEQGFDFKLVEYQPPEAPARGEA